MRKTWLEYLGFEGASHREHAAGDDPDFVRGKLARYVVDGSPTPVPAGVGVAGATRFAQANSGHMAMFLYASPTPEQIEELAEAWDLHPVLQRDLRHADQRPRLDRYDDTLFLVAHAARYVDETEEVEFGEFHILLRAHAVAIICHNDGWVTAASAPTASGRDSVDFGRSQRALLADRALLSQGPLAVISLLLGTIVDGYEPVIRGITNDKEQIERQVFSGDLSVAERIYRLSREVVEMQQALASMTDAVETLRSEDDGDDAANDEVQTRLDDVADRLERVASRVGMLREALAQILSVNATLVNQRQNEDMKRISGWAAILFAPSLISGLYGMNFTIMPELNWIWGYGFAIGLMLALAVLLYAVFKRSKWI
ncbi:magnesium and cobalt transport protein CorA [Microbacterium sp. GXF6406]